MLVHVIAVLSLTYMSLPGCGKQHASQVGSKMRRKVLSRASMPCCPISDDSEKSAVSHGYVEKAYR